MVVTLLTILLAVSPVSASANVHAGTGLQFPESSAGMRCSGLRPLDPARGEVSVAYHQQDPQRRFTATVFVYRKLPPASDPKESIADHLSRVRAEVAARYVGLQCEPWVLSTQRPGMSGLRCSGQFRQFGNAEMVTYIGLEDVGGGWWLKVRATALPADRGASEKDLAAVVGGISGPSK